MARIRILIIDDHPAIILGISKLFENVEDLELCGDASSVNEGLKAIETLRPDVILVDIGLNEDKSGLDFVKVIHNRYPGIIMLIHSMFDEAVYAERAVRGGAKGYFQKNADPRRIISGIRNAVKGELVLSENIKDRIITKLLNLKDNTQGNEIETLSNREFEIFQLFGKGYNIKEIAKVLNISQHTIETHRRNIREKLDIHNNNLLIKRAVEWCSSHNEG